MNREPAQMVRNTVHSYGGLMMNCQLWFSGKEADGAAPTAYGVWCLYNCCCKTSAEPYFHLSVNENPLQIPFG